MNDHIKIQRCDSNLSSLYKVLTIVGFIRNPNKLLVSWLYNIDELL